MKKDIKAQVSANDKLQVIAQGLPLVFTQIPHNSMDEQPQIQLVQEESKDDYSIDGSVIEGLPASEYGESVAEGYISTIKRQD